ncbi:MAG TPA: FAD-dependent oxidoreductase [Ktedonobacterales bacterium]|jgi:3-phenylpropionate/trans-cinnamate dioxygenase ferredoxin reductase subunit
MTTADARTAVDYLLIGGGLASATAAEEIRKRDAKGSVLIVAAEHHLPYHRPPLSKEYLRGDIGPDGTYGNGGVFAQLPPWYGEQRVAVKQGVGVTRLDTAAKQATLSDGSTVTYGRALLATGGRPRTLPIPGAHLPGIFVLRTLDDSTAIREQLNTPNRNVVVIGSGFIGLEAASNALFKGASVSIIDPVERVWPGMLTPGLSAYLENEYTSRGATFYLGHAAAEFIAGADGRVAQVRIAPQEGSAAPLTLPADMVLVGVGIQLNTDLATDASLNVDPHHGVMVDDHLRASAEDVYAAGDVASFLDPVMGRYHFEHWDNAIASGQTAAANMTGGDERYQHVPYFFSDQFDLSINMLGYPSPDAEVIIRGDPRQDAFTAVYIRDGAIRAALMVNDDAQMDTWRELIETSARPPDDREQLASSFFDPASLKRG